jgi:uncharacterized protein (TIGR02599 family)
MTRPLRFQTRKGFTLVEMLVATALIVLLLLFLVSMTDRTAKTWKYASSKTEQFQEARVAFESMTRRLSEATLNTYWDIEYIKVGTPPVEIPNRYIRQSELRFISGPMQTLVPGSSTYPTHGVFFQAPAGFVEDTARNGAMTHLLNTSGYFLEISDTDPSLPGFLTGVIGAKLRSRLMEFNQPSEKLSVYRNADPKNKEWFRTPLLSSSPPVRRLADNVVALVILPKLTPQDELARVTKNHKAAPLTNNYLYDSTSTNNDPDINPKNQLPPVLQVTMVAIDEVSAARLASRASTSADPGSQTSKDLGLETAKFFNDSTKLEDKASGPPEEREGDLTKFQAKLNGLATPDDLKLTYRVFTTNVSIRGAKWSKAQSDISDDSK